MTTPNGTPSADEAVRLLGAGAAACDRAGRPELRRVLDVAADRIRRPGMVICIVGEYKQGKSHLVNSLVGRAVCPVDDDLATSAITLVTHGEQATAAIRRRTDGGVAASEPIPLGDVAKYAAETPATLAPAGTVELVELAVDSALLERGVAVVDTPGVNAFRPGNDRAVLDFLPSVHGVVLVTDASTELSPPELRFLTAARDACPAVLIAMSKIDLYPEWRRIAKLNRRHLTSLGLADSLLPVSSTLKETASSVGDAALDAESGFHELIGAVERGILDTAARTSVERALADLAHVAGVLRSVESARLVALEDPAGVEAQLDELVRARAAVTRLNEADARWLTMLDDAFGELGSEVEYEVHAAMRRQEQHADRLLAGSDQDAAWDEVIADVKSAVVDVARVASDAVRDGAGRIGGEIARLLADDVPAAPDLVRDASVDVDRLWSSVERDLRDGGPGALTGGLSMLLGGSSMLGLLGTVAQVAGIAVLGPVSWSAGVVFGAKQFRDERRRQHDRQRQEARTVVRQFLDSVEVELALRTDRWLQDAQRSLRGLFAARIAELSATYSAAVGSLEESLAHGDVERKTLAAASRARIAELDRLLAAAGRAEYGR